VAAEPQAGRDDGAALVCCGVGKTWSDGTSRATPALAAIDLEVAQGEFVVVLGPSGCGKSTLLHLIAGLEAATAGKMRFYGQMITAPSPERSLIFQDASLFPWLTVWQNVSFGLALKGVGSDQRRAVAQEMLAKVGLRDAAAKRPHELSGGMRQRVAVARALAMRPKMLLMDEPFAALDVQTRAKMQGFLVDVWRESAASILFVTHHIDEAVMLADRVVVLTARPGRIKATITVDLVRPRDPFDPRSHELRKELTALLSEEVDRAFAEQEASRPDTRSADERQRSRSSLGKQDCLSPRRARLAGVHKAWHDGAHEHRVLHAHGAGVAEEAHELPPGAFDARQTGEAGDHGSDVRAAVQNQPAAEKQNPDGAGGSEPHRPSPTAAPLRSEAPNRRRPRSVRAYRGKNGFDDMRRSESRLTLSEPGSSCTGC
jgi:NitT/TauT family transport system ATP-binding protein